MRKGKESQVTITRSPRRKRTVSARLMEGGVQVLAPQDIPDTKLQEIVEKLTTRLEKRQTKRQLNDGQVLHQRAQELNQRYFKGKLKIGVIEYVTNQDHRFGSCTPKQ